ncbi:MAG: hypothetical protein JWL76_2274 [Thermoleophilia bacterium]|nr:hypothetical protein [Thermoleophilia bacterium]
MGINADIDPTTAAVLRVVWEAFQQSEQWPVYRHVVDRLKNDRVDTASEVQTWRPELFMHFRGSQVPYDNDPIGLRIRGLAIVGDTAAYRLANDASRALGWMAAREREYVAPPSTGERLRVTSAEIATEVGLHDRTVRQLYRILEMDPHVRVVGGRPDEWSIEVGDWAERYRGIETIEGYLIAIGGFEAAERMSGTQALEIPWPQRDALALAPEPPAAGALSISTHPGVDRSVRHLREGETDLSVREALREIEIRLRGLGRPFGVDQSLGGVQLVNECFGDGKPLVDPDMIPAEAQGQRALFHGAFGAVRNPTTHRDVGLTADEAAEWLGLTSGLHRMLDGVEARVSALVNERWGEA